MSLGDIGIYGRGGGKSKLNWADPGKPQPQVPATPPAFPGSDRISLAFQISEFWGAVCSPDTKLCWKWALGEPAWVEMAPMLYTHVDSEMCYLALDGGALAVAGISDAGTIVMDLKLLRRWELFFPSSLY